MVDDPPVPFTTFRMPPDPVVLSRKMVSRSSRLEGERATGTSNRVRGVNVYALVKKL